MDVADKKKRGFLEWTGIVIGGLIGLFVILIIIGAVSGGVEGDEAVTGPKITPGDTSIPFVAPTTANSPTSTHASRPTSTSVVPLAPPFELDGIRYTLIRFDDNAQGNQYRAVTAVFQVEVVNLPKELSASFWVAIAENFKFDAFHKYKLVFPEEHPLYQCDESTAAIAKAKQLDVYPECVENKNANYGGITYHNFKAGSWPIGFGQLTGVGPESSFFWDIADDDRILVGTLKLFFYTPLNADVSASRLCKGKSLLMPLDLVAGNGRSTPRQTPGITPTFEATHKAAPTSVPCSKPKPTPTPTPLPPIPTTDLKSRLANLAPGTIITLTGTGDKGFSGDPIPYDSAQLATPAGISVDMSGSLFIADATNLSVRRLDMATGIVTNVAGTGTRAGESDGFPATEAKIKSSQDVAVDADGNLFIAETSGDAIRRVDAKTGIISTIAGVGLNQPNGIALDCFGNLFIADTGNHRIRKVDIGTGIITTVAGTEEGGLNEEGTLATRAKLNHPSDVALDCNGNLFIADAGNQRIFIVDATSGIMTTVAGSAGNAGSSGDGGQATSATLFNPTGLAVDGAGNLFIADQNNQRIRKVDAATGTISTFAGTGVPGFSGDGGPAIEAQLFDPNRIELDSNGNLFIADTFNNRVRVVAGVAAHH